MFRVDSDSIIIEYLIYPFIYLIFILLFVLASKLKFSLALTKISLISLLLFFPVFSVQYTCRPLQVGDGKPFVEVRSTVLPYISSTALIFGSPRFYHSFTCNETNTLKKRLNYHYLYMFFFINYVCVSILIVIVSMMTLTNKFGKRFKSLSIL